MKYSLYLLLIITFLFCTAGNVQAGFVIKNHTAVPAIANGTTSNAAATILSKEDHHSRLLNTIRKFSHPFAPYRRQPSEWIGIIALLSGVLGLLVPGLNFLAILFGVLGMGRRCNTRGLAAAGFILGILELVFFLTVGGTIVSLILL